MNQEYVNAAAEVSQALRENGGPIEVLRSSGVYDPVEGDATQYAKIYEGYALLTRYTRRAVDGISVKVGDKAMLIEAVGAIEEEDRIVMNGIEWTVKSVDEMSPNGVDLIFTKVQVRR